MSMPSKIACPFALASGVISCILFKHLIRVVFPQPEGPIKAVIRFGFISRLIPFNALFVPNHASSFLIENLVGIISCCFRGCSKSVGLFVSEASAGDTSLVLLKNFKGLTTHVQND